MKENYNKESKKKKKKSFLISHKSKKYQIFIFIPDYCVPSDYFVKEELMIANYYVIKW